MTCWKKDWCETANREDYSGANLKALQAYADYLVRQYGAGALLGFGDVNVVISDADPPTRPGHPGIVAGEVGPGVGGVDYYIYLYRRTLVGRKLICTFSTVAHEFRHIVRIRIDNLPVEGPADPAEFSMYEQDAHEWAEKLASPWACSATC